MSVHCARIIVINRLRSFYTAKQIFFFCPFTLFIPIHRGEKNKSNG